MLTLSSVAFSHGEFEYIDDFLWTVDMKINWIAKDELGIEKNIGYSTFTIINPNHPTFKSTLHVFPVLSKAIQSIDLYTNFEQYERNWLTIRAVPSKFGAYGKIAFLKEIQLENEYENIGIEQEALDSIFTFLKDEMEIYFVLTDNLLPFLKNIGFRKSGNHFIAAL